MSSLGRLTAALGVAHNENTLALANMNFDFSLYKIEAPPEFHALGANLSTRRRREAENGTSHRTARKLGALFDGVLPRIPELARAYGDRVSEISLSQKHNPRNNGNGGPFAGHMGADGTAIWAAATSGASAIPVLLLACMLARIWSAPESTSLWVEIVESRRQELVNSCTAGEDSDFILLRAAPQELSRSELADWDASTRAWLRTADECKNLEQTQLMLIVNNLQLPVSNNMSVYQSIIDSSRSALTFMENIVKGVSQRVQSGAVLLGLSAWHIYPDMVVLGSVMREVKQKDKLIPVGTLVTLGLQSDVGIDQGVYWSLPLAHLRYYGDPVESSRSTGHDASRVSSDQLVYVALGAIFRRWVPTSHNIPTALQWVATVSACIDRAVSKSTSGEGNLNENNDVREFLRGPGWFKLLATAVKSLEEVAERDKELPIKLMALGHRRFYNFIANEKNDMPPFWGLNYPHVLFPLLRTDEDRIRVLRQIASSLGFLASEMVIKYKVSRSHDALEQGRRGPDDWTLPFEFATALPCVRSSTQWPHPGRESQIRCHQRWIAMRGDSFAKDKKWPAQLLYFHDDPCCKCQDSCQSECFCEYSYAGCHPDCWCFSNGQICSTTRSSTLAIRASQITAMGEDCIQDHFRAFYERNRRLQRRQDNSKAEIEKLHSLYQDTWTSQTGPLDMISLPSGASFEPLVGLEILCGHTDTAALYKIRRSRDSHVLSTTQLPLGEVRKCFEEDVIDALRLLKYLAHPQQGLYDPYINSLKALASLTETYNSLPEATIALRIASGPLHNFRWVSCNVERLDDADLAQVPWAFELGLASTFACIATSESGVFNIDPGDLEHVFAMSAGNSIFVAAQLLDDPTEASKPSEVKRVIGNIGRAGIAMLIPPQDPRIRKPEIGSWELINHAAFDGRFTNSFQNTSLHLSFTPYTMPLNVGDRGGQDSEAFFLESLVSVHDRGKWVADLDVLGMFRQSNLFFPQSLPGTCTHSKDLLPESTLIAIDNWEELLEREEVHVLVRAYQNPMARLAVAVISIKQGYPTIIIPGKPCWKCVTEQTPDSIKERTQRRERTGRRRFVRCDSVEMVFDVVEIDPDTGVDKTHITYIC